MSFFTAGFIPTIKTVIQTILGSLGYIYEYRHSLIKVLIVPVSLNLLITLANNLLDIPAEFSFLLAVVWTYLYAQIAISTHRILLLGPELASEWSMFSFRWPVLKFIAYSPLLALCAAPAAIFLLIPNVGDVLFILSGAYVFSRLSLVFPSIATGQDMTLADSWHATKDYQVMMLMAVGIIPGCFIVIQEMLQKIPYSYFPVTLLENISFILIVSLLSISYKIVSGNKHTVNN